MMLGSMSWKLHHKQFSVPTKTPLKSCTHSTDRTNRCAMRALLGAASKIARHRSRANVWRHEHQCNGPGV